MAKRLDLDNVNIYYGSFHAVADVSLSILPRSVTAFIGPSGCGKSTVLRTLNRMHEVIPGAPGRGLSAARRRGHLRAPASTRSVCAGRSAWCSSGRTRFPPCRSATTWSPASSCRGCATARRSTRSRNSPCAARTSGTRSRTGWTSPAAGLSGGQQQRLCIARAIAVQPDVLLMDEPCSALDPISTLAIEDLIGELKQNYTIVIVTHNMQQAARVSDHTAFFNLEAVGKPGPAGGDRRDREDLLQPAPRRPPRTTSPAASASGDRKRGVAGRSGSPPLGLAVYRQVGPVVSSGNLPVAWKMTRRATSTAWSANRS